MDEKLIQQVFDELFPYFEQVEAQSAAILYFLKAKGIASEEELAPHLAQAAKSSSVKWRAAQVRTNFLLSSAAKTAEKASGEESPKAAEKSEKEVTASPENEQSKPEKKESGSDKAASKEQSA